LAGVPGLIGPSASMMCQPNCEWTGFEILLAGIENATFSNSGTRRPLTAVPGGSLPPFCADEVSVENFFASAANLPGLFCSCD
jgi:hypothetical protein